MSRLKIGLLVALGMLLLLCTSAFAAPGNLATLDLKAPSDVTVQELQSALLYDLKAHADDYVAAYQRTGINPVFLAAKDAIESGWGRNRMGKYNVSGFFTKQSFTSVCHNIEYVSDFLDRHYLTPGGKFYRGSTVAGVNVFWNGNKIWEREVLKLMDGIYSRIDSYRAQHRSDIVNVAAVAERQNADMAALSEAGQQVVREIVASSGEEISAVTLTAKVADNNISRMTSSEIIAPQTAATAPEAAAATPAPTPAPTSAPTPEPTPEPTPAPTPEPTPAPTPAPQDIPAINSGKDWDSDVTEELRRPEGGQSLVFGEDGIPKKGKPTPPSPTPEPLEIKVGTPTAPTPTPTPAPVKKPFGKD